MARKATKKHLCGGEEVSEGTTGEELTKARCVDLAISGQNALACNTSRHFLCNPLTTTAISYIFMSVGSAILTKFGTMSFSNPV